MFGLKTPIAQSEKTDEFDSVSAILSQSSVARPSRVKQAPPWLSSISEDGGIFHLELPPGADATLVKHISNADTNSVSSLAIGAGCNSEDTGYSSDQDPWGSDQQRSSYISSNIVKRNKLKSGSSASFNKTQHKKDNPWNDIACDSFSVSEQIHSDANSANFHKSHAVGKDQVVNNDNFQKKGSADSNHSVTLTERDDEVDDGIFLTKSELRSSTASSISYTSKRSDCSRLTDRSTKDVNKHHKNLLSRFQKVREWKTIHVDLVFSYSKCRKLNDISRCDVSKLCENILGFTPGRNNDNLIGPSASSCIQSHQQVLVKSLSADGAACLVPEITIGSWVSAINGQEMTWDNMRSVLSTLTKLKKAKLTLKSLRSDKSTLDLEGLVSVLTSDPSNDPALALTNVAALYISMDGVDPGHSQDNDGVVYSYPHDKQNSSIQGLHGLFYTLAHVVRDFNMASAIRNSTVEVDGQPVHIAYLQEDRDILVFAMPAACVSLSELNTLLTGFSRLLWILYGSVQTAFRKGDNSVFIDNILTYLFRQAVSTASTSHSSSSSSSSSSSLSSSSLSASSFSSSFSSSSLLHKDKPATEATPLIRYSKHIHYLPLPNDHQMVIERTLNEFESSDFHDMSDNFYGCRRQYTILGTAYFYCGQLVTSHLSPSDLHDLHLYLQHLGVLDLMTRCNVSQFVAWREVFPTRFCHEVSEINNSFGYSEPISRWCFLVVGLNNGLFCCLLETVGSKSFKKSSLSPDVFYVDQAKACLLRVQSPTLMAALNASVNKERQSAFTKSDYCATYINTTGGKNPRLFSNEGGVVSPRNNRRHDNFMSSSSYGGSDWSKTIMVEDSLSTSGSVASPFDIYKSGHTGKMYPAQCDSFDVSNSLSFSSVLPIHRLSTTHQPSLYQYCCMDGMEGTIFLGSDMETSGLFHAHILHGFYKCCRQIHQLFNDCETQQTTPAYHSDEDDGLYDPLTPDPNMRGMKEHGILMTLTPQQTGEGTNKSKDNSSLEYWVVGRKLRRPGKKILLACFHVSTSENMVELAFRHSFGN